MSYTVLPGFESLARGEFARLQRVNAQLAEFVRAYDRYMIAIGGTDHRETNEAAGELDRQYELLDALESDRP